MRRPASQPHEHVGQKAWQTKRAPDDRRHALTIPSIYPALQLDDVGGECPFQVVAVQRRHRLVLAYPLEVRTETVEAGPHRAAVGAEHPDLDIVARGDVGGEHERPRHMVEIVAGRAVEAE